MTASDRLHFINLPIPEPIIIIEEQTTLACFMGPPCGMGVRTRQRMVAPGKEW